ncbi:MAG: hypothetical protein GC204_19160 [Chloroflexi bacterium]|nr:hypothetical protein [Chloroflexota bacterium]
MRNEAPSRSLVRRANQVKTLALLVGAVGVFVTAIGILGAALPLVYETDPSYGLYVFGYNLALVLGAALLVTAIALAIRAFTWKTDNDLAMITGRFLADTQVLDDRFDLIRNVSKREIGYVDAVLVGPPGVLVFRILDNEGNFANDGANWLRIKPTNESVPASINPTREAIADIQKMREFLEKRNLPAVPVYGVVVFIKDEQRVRLSAREPVVPPTHLKNIIPNLQPNYLAKDRIDQPTVEAIRRLLMGE